MARSNSQTHTCFRGPHLRGGWRGYWPVFRFTASHCGAEDGIRAVKSIPKANCLTSTRHISCSLILPPPYSSGERGFSGQSASLLRADVVCVWNSATFLLSSYWLDPLSHWESWEIWKESHQCTKETKSHFQYAQTVLWKGKRLETAPLFGSLQLEESSTFDWWLQVMSSRAYVTSTWRNWYWSPPTHSLKLVLTEYGWPKHRGEIITDQVSHFSSCCVSFHYIM